LNSEASQSTPIPRLDFLFRLLWLFIIAVSMYDAYLVLKLRDVINTTERNPLGLALLELAGGNVWLFLLAKVSGTVLACMLLLVLFKNDRKVGLVVASVIAVLQFALLLFLQFS
jgi:hypothetical protein